MSDERGCAPMCDYPVGSHARECQSRTGVPPAPDPGRDAWGVPFGTRVMDGGEPGVTVRCHECGGSGSLHKPDRPPAATPPTPDEEGSALVIVWDSVAATHLRAGYIVNVPEGGRLVHVAASMLGHVDLCWEVERGALGEPRVGRRYTGYRAEETIPAATTRRAYVGTVGVGPDALHIYEEWAA